ncbi:hypothetical protein G6L58_07330 [Agrobacterium tumefaciens]|uniref:hypothetical protein n=1 Tax=Agrobacterium tumefaciens TaxID=358 RepID=UPI0013CE583D|nr:hypothetical protein [Agrobacterium tumefaciens]
MVVPRLVADPVPAKPAFFDSDFGGVCIQLRRFIKTQIARLSIIGFFAIECGETLDTGDLCHIGLRGAVVTTAASCKSKHGNGYGYE